MMDQQESSTQIDPNGRPAPLVEPAYQIQCAAARLEAALQSLDLDADHEQAEAVVTALRATDRACELEDKETGALQIDDYDSHSL